MIYLEANPEHRPAAVELSGEPASAFYQTLSADGKKIAAAVRPELLGERITMAELTIGDFVLAVADNMFCVGQVRSLYRTGNGETSIELGVSTQARNKDTVWNPQALFRVEPLREEIPRGWFERKILKKEPQFALVAPSVAAILNQPIEYSRVSIDDQGKSIVIPSNSGRTWKIRTIDSARQGDYWISLYFADDQSPICVFSESVDGHQAVRGIILG